MVSLSYLFKLISFSGINNQSFEYSYRCFSSPYRCLSSPDRKLPDFVIIGAMKSGTTSLYNYLIQHPKIITAQKKEVHFFDKHFHKGICWYRSYFPLLSNLGYLTGEASPYYIFHPLVAQRIAKTIPQVKLIVVLRNPVDRAFSHYQMNVVRRRENLIFVAIVFVENFAQNQQLESV